MPISELSLAQRLEEGWLVLTQAKLQVRTLTEPIINLLYKKLLQHMDLVRQSGLQVPTRGNYGQVLDLIN